MNESEYLKLFAAVIAGGGATLIGKILFDWLKNRRGDPVTAGLSSNSVDRFSGKKCLKDHQEINTWKSGVDICLVQHKGSIEAHEKRLDAGSKDIRQIRANLAGLDKSYAVLASKIK